MTPPGPWTPEAVETLREMRANGYSASQIAAVLKVTRNSVIGKWHRLGLCKPAKLRKRVRRTRSELDTVNSPFPRIPRPAKQGKPMQAPIPAPTHEPPSLRLSVAELKPDSCRWIAGDPRVDATHCGHPVVPGRSWCAFHNAAAFRVGSQRDFDRMAAAHFGSGFTGRRAA